MRFFVLISLVALSACASIIDGNVQEVSVRTSSGESASCVAISAEEEVSFEAPAQVELHRSYYPAEITCNSGGEVGVVKTLSDVSNWGYGGAVLGIGIGAGVDTYTGAAFEYPEEITITLGETKILGKTDFNSNVEFE